MSRQTAVLSGLIVLLVSESARSQLPELRYNFEARRQYGYDITIKSETESYTQVQTGYSLFRVSAVADDEIRLVHDGFLDPERKVKPGTDTIDQGAIKLTPPPRSLVIDFQGRLVRSEELTPLDHVLGFLETLVLEPLPVKAENEWHAEQEIEIVESRFFGFRTPSDPVRKARERSDYRITEVNGDIVRVEKKYHMRTGEGASNASHTTMSGTGWFLFNQRGGVISLLSMNYRLITDDTRDRHTVTASVECRAMSRSRLEQLLAERELARKKMTGEAYAEGPRQALKTTERRQLLEDLRSRDPKLQETAIIRLISAERDDRESDFSVPLAEILHEADFALKLKAARALVVWATPEAEAALVEATRDATFIAGAPEEAGFPLAEAAYHALGTIGTESAARAIAEKIDEPTRTPIEVLKRMGPVAEVPLLDLLVTRGVFEQRAACEVLAEIGGHRSAAALSQAAESGNARSQASTALEAIASRQGLTVQQMLEKARSTAAAESRAPSTTVADGLRLWSDRTGRFQIEAVMLSVTNDIVKLKTRTGKLIDVPLSRLSPRDQKLVTEMSTGETPVGVQTSSPSPLPPPDDGPPAHQSPELVGGKGGFAFREVSPLGRPVVGVHFQIGSWGGKPALASITPIYERAGLARGHRPESVAARSGYALGAVQVDADDLVRALRFAFMRIDGDRLDTSDVYVTDWVGNPTGNASVTLSAGGKPVLGFHGRKGAVVDAIGIVSEGK